MTYDDGGVRPAATPPPPPTGYPGNPPPSYGPSPGYGPYPGYGTPPGYGTAPGYGPPPGYGSPPGYAPPSYGGYPGYPPPALKPGVIPLRPLGLSDIFNAAFSYIRVNPRATLGLTTIVVVVTQIMVLILTTGVPLVIYGQADISQVEDESASGLIAMLLSLSAAGLTSGLSGVVLSGMLTVVLGRAVFGAHITIREAWDRMRGRLPALLGLTLLEGLGAVLLFVVPTAIVVLAAVLNAVLGVLVGMVVVIGVIAVFVYLWTMLSFAPVLIVLERLPVFTAIGRSFALVRGAFWRVFGIRILGSLVAGIVAFAVGIPFTFGGQILAVLAESVGAALIAAVLAAVGGAIGQIVTAPFVAGVVVLLYTDRRIRAEAFDLVLQTGAANPGAESADATDHLWLVRRP